MYEGITPEENRLFTTSTGNWTGPITWEPGPVYGQTGVVRAIVAPDAGIAYVKLQYPYCKPLKKKLNAFTIATQKEPPGPFVHEIKLILTDGSYLFESPLYYLTIDFNWIGLGYEPMIPEDWKTNQTQLIIMLHETSIYETYLYLKYASLSALPKVDHLPILGVG
jgi:hypothetical protein